MKIDTRKALLRAGEYLVGEAKKNLVSKTEHSNGILLNSIECWEDEDGSVLVGSKLEYAIYVEMGTGLFAEKGNGRKDVPWRYQDETGKWWSTCGQHPKPFLRPALEDNKNKVIEIVGKNLEIKK